MKFNPFKDRWVRLDVDNPSTIKPFNYLRLFLGVPAGRLKHVEETMKVIPENVPQIWFFRKWTCPERFERPFGAHLTSPETTNQEIEVIWKKLGEFKYFTRHGYAPIKSGRLWSVDEILKVERRYRLTDLTDISHFTVSRMKLENFVPEEMKCVLFHPCYIYRYREKLKKILVGLF